MYLEVVDDYDTLSNAAARIARQIVRNKPDAAFLIATGDTPMGMYRVLAERRALGWFNTSRLQAFQLDEYLGLRADDPRSLYGWMKRSFLDPLGIAEDRVVRLPGDTPDPRAACQAYDRAIEEAGGIDLSILGLGPNRHLGFNEPPANPDLPTRAVALAPESIESNARYWGGEDRVPQRALTAGMAQLLHARRTLLLVSGERKRDILRKTLEGPVTPDVPASFLRRVPNVTVLADRAAAGALSGLGSR